MIIFKKIKWKNFLSTGNIFTTVDLTKNKTTLIVGENGAGKSTILDAITFALFGKSFRKINKPQLLNSITNSNLVVELEFNISNIQYKIIRGMKPTVFEIYKDNVLMNQSSDSRDYQNILEKQILKINYKSFCQVVILGSATFLPFMQLTTPQRREIIENLLDLEIFTTMNTLLKDKILENKETIAEVLNRKSLIEEKIKLTKENIIYRKTDDDQIIEEKKNVIKETNDKINSLRQQLPQIILQRKEIDRKIKDETKYTKKDKTLNQFKIKIENNVDNLQNEIKFFDSNDNCPTCKQKIDDIFKTETITDKKLKIQEYQEGLVKLQKEIDDNNVNIKEINSTKKQLQTLILEESEIHTKIESLEDYITSIQKEITKLSNKSTQDQDNKIQEYEIQLKIIEGEYNELIKRKNVLMASSTLLKDNGIKSRIIKKYIPIINTLINKYLTSLNFFVKFELDEEFNEKIKSRHRDEFSYSSFSEGERMRINLAILFAWREISRMRNSINTNILIMDEIFDSSLDVNATDEFLKLINAQDEKSNIFVISHKTDQLNDKFQNIIRFKKVKNFSRIQTKGIT
jgi:DNA repair exonuclease SbcCD ATPase subunit